MSRVRQDPLRALTKEERRVLIQIARSHNEPASHVARAKILLAVAEGKTYGEAAQGAAPRGLPRSNDAVSHLVSRFNREGLAALAPRQRTLRRATDGLPHVSTYTIWATLHDAGIAWQQSRTWCDTGQVKRRRKRGVVTVTDPDTEAKKR